MADQDAGRPHAPSRTAASSLPGLVSEQMRLVTPSRFLIHPARHVEIGKLEPGLRALVGAGAAAVP